MVCIIVYMIAYPTILQTDINGLLYQINRLSPYFSHFQIDICDGIYTESKTVQVKNIVDLTQNKNIQYPGKTFEFHLMVKDFQSNINDLINVKKYWNINNILIHANLSPDYSLLTKTFPQFSHGLVLNLDNKVDLLYSKYDVNSIPYIQIMSIKIGAQGNPFVPEALKKVEQLRSLNYRNKVLLDGSVNEKTIPFLKSLAHQPDYLCPGAFLSRAENLENRMEYLKEHKIGRL